MKKIKFKNFITCDIQSAYTNDGKAQFINSIKDYANGTVTSAPQLIVTVAATHAGIITRNNAFYRPDIMRRDLPNFTSGPFPKPVLLHHNESQDPVGRVKRSEYKDLSYKYLNPLNEFKNRYGGLVFTDAHVDKDKAFDQIDWVIKNLQPMKDYVGLGYGELDLHITDAKAAEKILDERYLTVSVGFSTTEVYCSICKSDWAADGRCEHTPGKMYDEAQMALVPFAFEYDEVSWVNSPADKYARTINIMETNIIEAPPTEINSVDFATIPILLSVKDSKVYRLDSVEVTQEITDVPKQIEKNEADEKTVISDNTEVIVNDETSSETETIAPSTDETNDQTVTPNDTELESNSPIKDEISVWDETTYDQFMAPLLNDAKLTAEQIAALTLSDYCGPNKSFPVPDCAHVTAARQLLEKYTGPGSKDRIAANIEKKARTLQCSADQFAGPVEVALLAIDNSVCESLVFATLTSLKEYIASQPEEFIDFNKEKLEAVAQAFGVSDSSEIFKREVPLAEAVQEAESQNPVDINIVAAWVKALQDMQNTELRNELVQILVDSLIGLKMLDNIYEEYNNVVKELDLANKKIAQLVRTNADMYGARQLDVASLIVAAKVAIKAPEFVDLTDEQQTVKIKDLKLRSIDSLYDTLKDILSELSSSKANSDSTEPKDDKELNPNSVELKPETKITDSYIKWSREDLDGLSDDDIKMLIHLKQTYNRIKS